MSSADTLTGNVFDIQRFSIHDGPGIRTTVFLKGCPLRCLWCHNPESWKPSPELMVNPEKCVQCGRCVEVCPQGVHRITNDQKTFDRSLCRACGRCAEACPAKALELCGKTMNVCEVMHVVERDRDFYAESGGGLTLSGGEPTAQPDFSVALLTEARRRGIHTLVETCGYCSFAVLKKFLPVADLFFYDIKAEAARHEELTGVSMDQIRKNLKRLLEHGAKVEVRIPMIPGVNDTPEFRKELEELPRDFPRLESITQNPYHRLGEKKREQLGQ